MMRVFRLVFQLESPETSLIQAKAVDAALVAVD